jgi:hypothetical protein
MENNNQVEQPQTSSLTKEELRLLKHKALQKAIENNSNVLIYSKTSVKFNEAKNKMIKYYNTAWMQPNGVIKYTTGGARVSNSNLVGNTYRSIFA